MATDIRPPPEELVELLGARRAQMAPLALALREMVLREAPDAIELIYSSYAVVIAFTLTGKTKDGFCHVVTYPNHVNLGFNQGALLADPHKLLVGTGKKIRHIRIDSEADLQLPLRGYVHEAVERAARAGARAGGVGPRRALAGRYRDS